MVWDCVPPIVAAGRLAVAEPALSTLVAVGLVNVPDGRAAAETLSLIEGVVLTAVDLPAETLLVSVLLTAVTLFGTVLPAET